ncbi:BlaI/MecI/CopY family transcriptional regulator [Streptomyces sp. NPDC005195]|uniref:BlaI/MecI/CopY family transcriptional regulator n=1 Tax=Streptomyces sp. NPDC005195 TaxID=3154561 RepID=UPI0033A3B003
MSDKRRDGGRPHGELVAEVPAVLSEAGEPLTARQVDAALGRGPVRTTTATILTRLHERGTVRRIPSGRGLACEQVRDAAGLLAGRMRHETGREPRRDLVLRRFASSLSANDEDTSRRLLLEAGDGSE